MKKIIFYLLIIFIFSTCFVNTLWADEIAELKNQMKKMQKNMEKMQNRIEELERAQAPSYDMVSEKTEQKIYMIEEKLEKVKPSWTDMITLKGSLYEYYFSQNNNYFGKSSSHFLETTGRLGADIRVSEQISAELQFVAENAIGDAGDYTGVTTDDWNVELELANITYSNIFDTPVSLTAGRQNLMYGDGFLICDGYTDMRANWTASITSFYAIKGVYKTDPVQIDAFAALVDSDYFSTETYFSNGSLHTGKRNLYGGNVHIDKWGTWDLGVFYRNDYSDLQSDTIAFSQRGSYTFDLWPESSGMPQITVTGEIVEEFGKTKVKDYTLVSSRQDRQAFGGHLDTKFTFEKLPMSPYLMARYIYLPGDNPDTSETNEAFDPMYYGFSDWGTWIIGDINSYNLFNYNERVAMGEIGFSPTSNTSLRAQYFYVKLDRPFQADHGKEWSQEVDLIFDYFLNDHFFFGAALAYSKPSDAAKGYFGNKRDTYEFMVWSRVHF